LRPKKSGGQGGAPAGAILGGNQRKPDDADLVRQATPTAVGPTRLDIGRGKNADVIRCDRRDAESGEIVNRCACPDCGATPANDRIVAFAGAESHAMSLCTDCARAAFSAILAGIYDPGGITQIEIGSDVFAFLSCGSHDELGRLVPAKIIRGVDFSFV